ncbi:MAG: phosphoribosylformylglycinamidine synthase, partial [Verrucomicrobiales bacterium]
MKRLFVEKKPQHRGSHTALCQDLQAQLALPQLKSLRCLQVYEIDGLSEDQFAQAARLILAEAQIDDFFTELELPAGTHAFALSYLPGQFDQRADSAAQAIQILTEGEKPLVTSAQVYLLEGALDEAQLKLVKDYLINPVDSHEIPLPTAENPPTPPAPSPEPADVARLTGFTTYGPEQLQGALDELGLAMSFADLAHTQAYFRDEEQRDPSITEIRMLDTYWSDHCRHTTFLTKIDEVTFDEGCEVIEKTYQSYLDTKSSLGRDDKPTTLMDIALMGMRELRASGELDNIYESAEINAASIIVPVKITPANDGSSESEQGVQA